MNIPIEHLQHGRYYFIKQKYATNYGWIILFNELKGDSVMVYSCINLTPEGHANGTWILPIQWGSKDSIGSVRLASAGEVAWYDENIKHVSGKPLTSVPTVNNLYSVF